MIYAQLAGLSTLRKNDGMCEQALPRRRNAQNTKAAILDAAEQAFAEIGYTPAGIRTIASMAGVDSALVQRYFGSKAGLFEAALSQAIPDIGTIDVQPAQMGSVIASNLLHNFLGLRAQAMIVLSTSDPEARLISARVLKARVIEPMSALFGPPDAEAKVIKLVMLSTAFLLYTQQIKILDLEKAGEGSVANWLERTLRDLASHKE